MYTTIVDCEHFTDTIGKFETEAEAEAAGKEWVEFQQLDFLGGFSEADRMAIDDRCRNGEDLDDILYDELGFDCTYGVVEEIADNRSAGHYDHLKDEQSPGHFDRYVAGDR
jgi:uncharacterized protein YutD